MSNLLSAGGPSDDSAPVPVVGGTQRDNCVVVQPTAADSVSRSKQESPNQATSLVELVDGEELFHNAAGDTFGRYTVDAHYEISAIRSRAFRTWLLRRYYLEYGRTPSSQALQDALGVIEGQAQFSGDEREVYVRNAEHQGRLYLDLCNSAWQVVEIDSNGWRIVDESPVMFRRAKTMLPLPTPAEGGSLDELKRIVNVSDDDWALVAAWLVAALRSRGPYPILAVHGEQGSAKSTLCRILRKLIDPNKAPLRSEPRDPRDFMIAATNSWVVAYDNLSYIPPWLSDAMCRLSTGGGFATRTLFENDDETVFEVQRPLLINGIEEIAARSDLLNRCLLINLPRIEDTERRTEDELESEFQRIHPRVVGALLTAVSIALKRRESIKLNLPRMADFATWAAAAEPALGLESGEFIRAYKLNLEIGDDTAIDASPVGNVLIRFMEKRRNWTGTATQLLQELEILASFSETRTKAWPKTARSISGIVRRLAPNLRKRGIGIDFNRSAEERTITLTSSPESTAASVTQMTQQIQYDPFPTFTEITR